MMFSSSYGRKTFPASSTPVRLSEDSGYCGSGERKNTDSLAQNFCYEYSPIRECKSHNKALTDYSGLFLNSESYRDKILCKALKYGKSKHLDINSLEEEDKFDFTDSISGNYSCDSNIRQSDASKALTESFRSRHIINNSEFQNVSQNFTESYSSWNLETVDCQNENRKQTQISRRQFVPKQHIDFLHELQTKNCAHVLSIIFSHLSDEDLCRVSCVSNTWRKLIFNDVKANKRRKNNILQLKKEIILAHSQKENKFGSHAVEEREHKTAFSNISNLQMIKQQPPTLLNHRFNSFLKEAESLNDDQVLRKCPRCCYASRNQNEKYLCVNCSYTFCSKCLGPYLTSHTCSKPEVPKIIIGSRQSKNNLKRLRNF